MNEIVFGSEAVVAGRSSQVPMLVDVDLEAVGHEGPLPHVKLSLLVKERFLDVFLEHPCPRGNWLRKQKLLDVL